MAFQIVGVLIIIFSMFAFLGDDKSGENSIKFLGLELKFSTSSIAFLVAGFALLIFPYTSFYHGNVANPGQKDELAKPENVVKNEPDRLSPPSAQSKSIVNNQVTEKLSGNDNALLSFTRSKAIELAEKNPDALGMQIGHTTFYPDGKWNLHNARFTIAEILQKYEMYPQSHLYIVSQWSPSVCSRDVTAERNRGFDRALIFEKEFIRRGLDRTKIRAILSNYYANEATENIEECDNNVFHFVDFYLVRESD